MKKVLINQGYALICQLICIPLLGSFSAKVYYNYVYLNKESLDIYSELLILALIIIFNLIMMYALTWVFNDLLKMPLIYFLLTGTVIINVLAINCLYTIFMVRNVCHVESALDCVQYIKDYHVAICSLIGFLAYFILYFVMKKITKYLE